MKLCKTCGRLLDEIHFHVIRRNKNGSLLYNAHCKECYRKKELEKYHSLSIEEKRERKKRSLLGMDKDYFKKYKLRKYYGLSLDQFNDMVNKQDSKCYICGEDLNMSDMRIDHDHNTGKVRKILCHTCNTGLGFLKEDVNILQNCIDYIIEHG